MEITALTSFLAPLLPVLIRTGQGALDALSDLVGTSAAEKVHALWQRLGPAVAGQPAAEEAARDVAAEPDDGRRRTVLEVRLGDLLATDLQLAADVEALFSQAVAAVGRSVTVTGDRAVGIAGDVSDSIINTGDDASIGR
jgi:hypothetical protein